MLLDITQKEETFIGSNKPRKEPIKVSLDNREGMFMNLDGCLRGKQEIYQKK
ncbi:hypothetical protein SD77_1702 [Bacillus badius]|uniref:Mobile element protein n=1 Tax=Bacillus badius TaxID=1455 RepID=A0ABR5AR73_BACBA|nr:hypothetical protein SD77_1702 [Bacillus badius]